MEGISSMRILKILSLSALLLVGTASLVLACDGKAKAEGASASASCAEHANAEAASAAQCKGAANASAVKTADVTGCRSAAVKTAGAAGCTAAETASASGCAKSATAGAVQVETVRMPSGALAVFYNGANEQAVEFLQASAEKGCHGFACHLAQSMAADEKCTVEMAETEHGVMILVTAEDPAVVDAYEAQYAAVMSGDTDEEQGE